MEGAPLVYDDINVLQTLLPLFSFIANLSHKLRSHHRAYKHLVVFKQDDEVFYFSYQELVFEVTVADHSECVHCPAFFDAVELFLKLLFSLGDAGDIIDG